MQIDINDVVTGSKYHKQVLYVCDYRKENTSKKAIRNVKPTKVIVLKESDFIEAGKKYPRVYYSESALVELNKKGEPVYSKVIPPYDNTGYRSYAGVGMFFFDNLDECIDAYNTQVQFVMDMYERAILSCTQELMNEHKRISELKVQK